MAHFREPLVRFRYLHLRCRQQYPNHHLLHYHSTYKPRYHREVARQHTPRTGHPVGILHRHPKAIPLYQRDLVVDMALRHLVRLLVLSLHRTRRDRRRKERGPKYNPLTLKFPIYNLLPRHLLGLLHQDR